MGLLGKSELNLTPEEKELILNLRKGANPSPDEVERLNPPTLGERLADVGGSWGFILTFIAVLIVWIAINSFGGDSFDPYPFILLNLVLSCLAAVQAPIIMMSQNRQEVKDRARAEADYRTNLEAEREIRELQRKLEEVHRIVSSRQ